MATGDFKNNLQKLQKELKHVRYAEAVDINGMTQGVPAAFLPIYHYVFTNYSHAIAELISATDTELYGKTDFKFMEAMYKILRDIFNYKPPITKEQFFNSGFAERKIIMCADVVQKVKEKNKTLQPAKKTNTSAMSTVPSASSSKPARPKSADASQRPTHSASMTVPKTKHFSGDKVPHRPMSAHHSKTGRQNPPESTSPKQVVNELRQPPKEKPQSHRHVAHQSTTEHHRHVKSPPRVTKQVLSQCEPGAQQNGDQFQQMVSSTPSISRVRSSAVEVVSVPRGFNIGPDDIETVNAVTRGDSFLEPRPNNTNDGAEVWQAQVNSLYQTMDSLTSKLGRFESKLMNITNTVQSQIPQTDERVLEVINTIQQHLETLNARMVLVENRVSMLEAKAEMNALLPSATPSQGSTANARQQSLTNQNASNFYSLNQQGSPHKFDSPKSPEVNAKTEEQPVSTVQSSVPSHVRSCDDSSSPVGLSPIRKVPDAGSANGIPLGDSANEDTFAMVTDEEARRSSTPTEFANIRREIGNDSMSFINIGDQSTQERVDRIKNLVRSTEEMLKPT